MSTCPILADRDGRGIWTCQRRFSFRVSHSGFLWTPSSPSRVSWVCHCRTGCIFQASSSLSNEKSNYSNCTEKIRKNYIPDCGKMIRLLSDNETSFTSPRWENTLEKEEIKVIFSSIRRSKSNPTECVMKDIGRLFRRFCVKRETAWAEYVNK